MMMKRLLFQALIIVFGNVMTTADQTPKAPALEELFYPVVRQLILVPAESDAVMARVLSTGQVPPGHELEEMGPRTGGVWKGFRGLKAEYGWDAETPHVRFPQEGGRYDIVRTRYRRGSWVLEMAESRHMWALRIMGEDLVGRGLEVARRVAHEIFLEKWDIRLIYVGKSGDVTFGKHDLEATGLAAQFQHWRDTLRWWYQPGMVVFVGIDAYGWPRRVPCLGPSDQANRYWFTEDPNEHPR
jgi:hypothetical protein